MQCTALAALLVAMLDNPPAARALERAGGLPALASLLRDGGAERPVAQAARACLGAYLVPEEPDRDRRIVVVGGGSGRAAGGGGSGRSTGTMRRRAASPSPAVGGEAGRGGAGGGDGVGGAGAAGGAVGAREGAARRAVRRGRCGHRARVQGAGDARGRRVGVHRYGAGRLRGHIDRRNGGLLNGWGRILASGKAKILTTACYDSDMLTKFIASHTNWPVAFCARRRGLLSFPCHRKGVSRFAIEKENTIEYRSVNRQAVKHDGGHQPPTTH